MGWKSWPSWFLGGLLTSIIFTFFDYIKELSGTPAWSGYLFLQKPLGIIFKTGTQGFLQSDFMLWTFTILFYFIIGALITAIVYNVKKES